MKSALFILAYFSFLFSESQNLALTEIIGFPKKQQEELADIFSKKSWSNHNFEMVSDSNFNRRIWIKENPSNNLKSYFIHYEYQTDTSENYIIYQFSDRKHFLAYKSELKEKDFSKLKQKTKKKNKKDIHKEFSEIYYSEKYNSVLILKDVFFYGMNTFMVYAYKYHSAIAKNLTNIKNN